MTVERKLEHCTKDGRTETESLGKEIKLATLGKPNTLLLAYKPFTSC